ncbi:MAG TPA: aldo/keto reductase [Longimicrobiaceae bacterium]|nr:aldo/keto reductase [Longimicrobiaceae bacterium]
MPGTSAGGARMERVELGKTGRRVSRIGLGGMPLSIQGRPEREQAKAVVHRAVRLGVTLIDTADVYCLNNGEIGHNERLIREALDGIGAEGAEVVIATKGGMTRPEGRWERNGHPRHLRAACERSLRALEVETIDLYQLHTPDPRIPFEDSVGEISRLHEEGKVRAVGLSNVTLDQIRSAQEIVEITSVQNRYNPWDRASEEEGILRYCDESRITFLPYSPVGGGRRVGLLRESDAVKAVAARLRATPEEAVIAWILGKSPSLVPIPGATRTESIESSVRAAGVGVDEEVREELEAAFASLPE